MLWCGILTLSRELTKPVFADIAFSTVTCTVTGIGVAHLKTPCSMVKTFFNVVFSEISLKITKKKKKMTAPVFLQGTSNFLATPLQ